MEINFNQKMNRMVAKTVQLGVTVKMMVTLMIPPQIMNLLVPPVNPELGVMKKVQILRASVPIASQGNIHPR
jgi:hypothetical protein